MRMLDMRRRWHASCLVSFKSNHNVVYSCKYPVVFCLKWACGASPPAEAFDHCAGGEDGCLQEEMPWAVVEAVELP